MAILGRLRCHFCGARSSFKRGTTHFECARCEARNFFDTNGNVVDPSLIDGAPTNAPPQTFTKPLPKELIYQQSSAFCDTCIKNQQIFVESISNYFPDDDDPRYPEYERGFEKYKEELERRYPQVCSTCAPKAQTKIHHADLYGQTHALAVNTRSSRDRQRDGKSIKGLRDSPGKRFMRASLRVVDIAVSSSLLTQITWHLYGIGLARFPEIHDVEVNGAHGSMALSGKPTLRYCSRTAFNFEPSCFYLLETTAQKALTLSALLLWYNPALKYRWHDTYRVDYTYGKAQYFWMQLIMTLFRGFTLYTSFLGDALKDSSAERVVAIHLTIIIFLLLLQWISRRNIGYHKQAFNSKIMPLPHETDVLGAIAGPAKPQQTSKASSVKPLRLFQREEAPFPIQSLARNKAGDAGTLQFGHPSPPDSQSTSSAEDAMDIDWRQSTAPNSAWMPRFDQRKEGSLLRNSHQSDEQGLGWAAMRNEAFRIEDNIRTNAERKRQEAEAQNAQRANHNSQATRNIFRGALPPAPMSMERRLRNPPGRPNPQRTGTTAQTDFMSNMRNGIQEARTFRLPQQHQTDEQPSRNNSFFDPDLDGSQYDPDEVKPSAPSYRGSRDYEVRPGQWTWRGDLDAQSTGLEDLFGGRSFRIAEESPVKAARMPLQESKPNSSLWLYGVSVLALAVAVALCFWLPARRAVALFLFRKLEENGF